MAYLLCSRFMDILYFSFSIFPPTANIPQNKFGIPFILSVLTCCFLRHVFICPIDHFHSFPYSFFVTNRKRERTALPTVRSFSHTQVLQKQVRCRVIALINGCLSYKQSLYIVMIRKNLLH